MSTHTYLKGTHPDIKEKFPPLDVKVNFSINIENNDRVVEKRKKRKK